jgi:aryl-alcohol dehydrogenase-like predicted oxidoreductase
MSIPLRDFGKTGVKISALGLGGHHLGGAKDEKTAKAQNLIEQSAPVSV